MPIEGKNNFRANLPGEIGNAETLEKNIGGFGSSHPEPHPSTALYGAVGYFSNGYHHPDGAASYVAYQFYKHSKYGPCDKLVLTDGTFTEKTNPNSWTYNGDGKFYQEFTDRELGNTIVLAPGTNIRWMRSRQRCPNEATGLYPKDKRPNEATGFYAEDVRPFGFRVTQAISDGFSFLVAATSSTSSSKTYTLTIVDPSVNSIGAATYEWAVTDYIGKQTDYSGDSAKITVPPDPILARAWLL